MSGIAPLLATVFTDQNTLFTFNGTTIGTTKMTAKTTATDKEFRGAGSQVPQRVNKSIDAEITFTCIDTDDTAGLSLAAVQTVQFAKTHLTALSFGTTATTPVSRLASAFFTLFPMANWGVSSVDAGGYIDGVGEINVTLKPNYADRV